MCPIQTCIISFKQDLSNRFLWKPQEGQFHSILQSALQPASRKFDVCMQDTDTRVVGSSDHEFALLGFLK